MCVNSEGSCETARMRGHAWAFAGRLCDKYHYLMSWLTDLCVRVDGQLGGQLPLVIAVAMWEEHN